MNEITDGPIGFRLMNSPRMLMRSLRNGENLWRVYPDITSGVYVEGQNMRINEIAVVENKDEGTGVRYLEWNLQVEHMQAPNQNEYWGMMITQPQGEGEDTVWIPFTPNSASTESGGAMTPVNGYYKGPAIPREAGDSQSEIFKIRTEVPEWDKTLKFKFVKLDADGNLLEGTSVEQDFKTQRPIPDKIKVNIPGYTGDVTLGIQGAELEIPYTVRMRDGAGYLYETGAVKGTEVRLEAPEGYEIVSPEGERAIVQRNDESGEHYLNYSIRKITNPAEMLWKFRVTDIDGNPVEGASVKVTDLDGKVLEGISRVDGLTEVKGMFIDDNFTRFNIEVCKAGYHTDDKPVYYSSSESSIKLAIAESKPSQFNIAVRDSEDNSAVTGTVLSVTDDLGNVLTGEVSAEGTVSFNGNFTPCMPYDIKTVSVPEGYYRPDIQKVKYEESESDPAVSEIQIIKLKKAPVVPGEVKIKTNLSDADVTVDIYRGSEISGTPLLSDVSIPRNETVSLYNFEENQIYTVAVKGVSDEAKYGRNIGLAKNFVYEFTNPEELITLEEYPESVSGELRIRIYEESRLGPLTKRLNGRRIVLEDSQSEDYFATIQNGEAVFTGLTPGEKYRVKGVPLFKKYSIVKNDEITIGEEGNFEDWIIVKKSSTVYLTVKAPQARAFPDDMTVKIVDPSNNRVIAGPVKVENGILKFDNIPQGKIFNFVYDNVPEKWTHEYNGKTPFYAEENSSSVTVNDYFECGETASENSILSIYVRDRDGSPVSGYSFKLKDSQGNLIEPELTTGYDGRAVHEFIPKLEGKYTLVNTAAKEGYNSINVKDVLDFTEKSSEGVEITVSQSSPEHSNIYITVLDENERPVTDKQLKLYKTKNGVRELVDGELQTNHEGRVNLTGITVDEEAVYSFVLEEGDDSYSLNPQESENIRFSNGTDENIIFHLRTNSEYGKINISTKTVKGYNAPFVNFVIYKGEEEIYRGKTNFAGNYTTDFLKIGQYRVEIDPDDSYNELAEIDKVKNVNIISNGIYPAEFNKLEKKYLYISDAGDIEITGEILDYQSEWKVKITKYPNSETGGIPGAKRGAVNAIWFSDKELINIHDTKLTINGVRAEPNGQLVKNNGYYVFTDDQTANMTDGKVVYEYTFKADGLPDPPPTPNPEDPEEPEIGGYTVFATSDIISNSSQEKIERIGTAHKVTNLRDKGHIDITGRGYTMYDMDQVWAYEISTASDLEGKFNMVVSIPEGDPYQEDFNTAGAEAALYRKDAEGNLVERINVIPVISADGKSMKISVPVQPGHEGEYRLVVKGKAKANQYTDVYRQNATLNFTMDKFDEDGNPYEKLIESKSTVAISPGILPPPSEIKTETLGCGQGDTYKASIIMKSEVSEDRTRINWTIKVLNAGTSNSPFDLRLMPGEGLGPVENLNIQATGNAFPFITRDSFIDPDDNSNKDFQRRVIVRTNNFRSKRFVNALDTPRARRYLDGREKDPEYIKKYFPYIILPDGVTEVTRDTAKKKIDPLSNEEFQYQPVISSNRQHFESGEFIMVSFSTPVTDFSRAATDEGYRLNIGADMYETRKFLENLTTYTDTPICSKLSHMDVKIDKYQNEGHICELLGHYGSVILSGKYSEDGTAINWNLNSSYDKVKKALGDAEWADVRYELQFVDKNGNPIENLADIGLSTDHTIVRTTNGKVTSIDGALTANDSKTKYIAKGRVYSNHVDNLTITTPLLEDGPFPKDYRLKITGWMDPQGTPPQESIGECVATVEGKKLTVSLEKNWKNIEEDSVLPEAEFVLYQRNMDGLVKKMETKTLPETDIANIPSGSPYEKLYDENGFKGAVGKVIFTEQPAFDDAGNRYFYFVEESPLDGYNIAKTVEGKRDEQISITNTKRNKYKEQKDPTKYTADNEGVYPEDYRQDSIDVRNAKTEFDESLLDENKVPLGNDGTPYKIDYEDAIIGKRAVETDIPGEFDMELTIEGKTDGSGNGTISNGIVKDPMGTYLNIKDTNGDGEITHTVTGFQDGDIILEAQDQSLLDGVTVSYIDDADNDKEGFEISNISLKSGESIKIRYKVRLDSDMFGYTAGVYYQTNGTTTLQPRPGAPQEEHPEILRYFPIPSVKGTSKSIGVRKRWEVGGSEITGTAVEDLTAAFKLLRYTAKDPYQKDLPSQIDENVELLEVTISELTKDNNMETVYEGLTAFNSEGKEYIYKWVEEPSAIGRHERWELKRDRQGRPVTKTLIGGQEVLYTRYIFDKENGGRFEGPVSAEEGTAVSKGPLLRTEFTNEYLYEEKLPVTGGLGVDIYRIGGFILLAIGTTAVYSKKKNQKLKKDNN